MYNENEAIPMDGTSVHYEENATQVVPAGKYRFRIAMVRREQVNQTDKMPRHINMRWMMILEDADGERGRVWDNLRMYNKWLWKYAQVAKAIGHTAPESPDVRIDWSRFEGATGMVEASLGDYTRKDGTTVKQNSFKYLATDPASARSAGNGTQEEISF